MRLDSKRAQDVPRGARKCTSFGSGNRPRAAGDLCGVNHNRTKLLLAPVVAAALTLSLVACGSDDDSSSSDTAAVTTDDMSSADTTMTTDDMGDTGDMAGGEATVGDITITDAWVREPAEGQTLSAAYGTITNSGDTDITLVGASVPFDATVEIHETLMGDDGAMQMQEREDGFVIPAGETFELEPGGPHIMMIDIDPGDIVGGIEVTLIFDDGTELTVTAPVRTLDGTDAMGDSSDDMVTGTTMAG